jgi:hypothetical protein
MVKHHKKINNDIKKRMDEVDYTTARPTSRLIWNRNFTVIIEEIIQFYRKKISLR